LSALRRRDWLAAAASLPLWGCHAPAEITGGFTGTHPERGHLLRGKADFTGGPTRHAQVVVAGAGIAGLAAARALRLAGIDDVVLLDLEDQAGGNSRGGNVGGIACPLGAHYLPVPGDAARERQLLAVREAVPAGVNARIGRASTLDGRIAKTAADMIVPYDRLEELLTIYEQEFRARGLDAAVWGHVSDGNLHPNVIPRSFEEAEAGKAAILVFGREVIRLGGSPLAEHGVGRNPVKQRLLLDLYGRDGIDDMRAVKRALDPEFKLAPGVLFER